MFAYLKGTLASKEQASVIIEVNGIGYSLFIPNRTLEELPMIGESVQLFTSFVVREFSHALYGFLSIQERDVFEILLNVSGIGPKLALSLIGYLTLNDLQNAVTNQNFEILCRVPGVGKKTAERLIVELKDKLAKLYSVNFTNLVTASLESKNPQFQDAIQALINLGYNQSTAIKAIKKSLNTLPLNSDLALIITTALQHL